MAKEKQEAKTPVKVPYPEKYTASAIVGYLSERHLISRKIMKVIIEDLFDVVRRGMFSGARVPLGTMGKVYVRVRPATPERKGRNPATGQEIIIKAKPATKIPRITFSKVFKELVKNS